MNENEKRIAKLNEEIGEKENEIIELERLERESKVSHVQIGKYFTSSDGISYTAYHKVKEVNYQYVGVETVSIGDYTLSIELHDSHDKIKFSRYYETTKEEYDKAYNKALEELIQNKPE